MLIATGSDNSSKYFNYYFKDYKSIIRKNRRSIAILEGKESENDLKLLSKDIFMYLELEYSSPPVLGYSKTDFNDIFSRQCEGLVNQDDIVIAISTSGNSKNVLAAAKAAAKKHIVVIAMTGKGGGKLADASSLCLAVPSAVTMHIQESHIALGHAITLAVERLLGHE